jgi:hypothetical protein
MRFSTGILAIILLALMVPVQNAHAGLINNLTANGSGVTGAAFYHGYIDGNDAEKDGQPLLGYLNSGTDGVNPLPLISFDSTKKNLKEFTIASGGMFTKANPDPQTSTPEYNYIEKSAQGVFFDADTQWTYRGKYETGTDQGTTEGFVDGSGGLTIEDAGKEKTGVIDVVVNNGGVETGLSGDWVVSLKAGPEFSVFAFQGLVNVTQFSFANLPHGLSHVAIYQADSETPSPGPMVPEPTSLSIFCIAGLMACARSRRRR